MGLTQNLDEPQLGQKEIRKFSFYRNSHCIVTWYPEPSTVGKVSQSWTKHCGQGFPLGLTFVRGNFGEKLHEHYKINIFWAKQWRGRKWSNLFLSSRGTPHLFWAVGGPSTITGNPAGTPLLLKAYWITFCGNQSNIYPNQQKQNSFLLFEQYFYVSLLKINKFLYQTYGHTERLQFSSLKLLSRMLVCNLKACSNSLICLSEFVFKGSTFALKTVTNEFNIWLSHNLFSNITPH